MIGTVASRMASVSPLLLRRRTTSAIVAAAARGPRSCVRPGSPYSSYQPPNPPKQNPSSSSSSSSSSSAASSSEKSSTYATAQRAFYRDFGAPVAKVFLGALVTYQVLYWGWLKLESLETKEEKTAEIASLEAQVKDLAADKKTERN